jgi:hypothetical protein
MAKEIQPYDGGPAFPGGTNETFTDLQLGEPTQSGMTLRDYFAARAVQAVIGSCNGPMIFEGSPGDFLLCAQAAYRIADAMLVAREKSHG